MPLGDGNGNAAAPSVWTRDAIKCPTSGADDSC